MAQILSREIPVGSDADYFAFFAAVANDSDVQVLKLVVHSPLLDGGSRPFEKAAEEEWPPPEWNALASGACLMRNWILHLWGEKLTVTINRRDNLQADHLIVEIKDEASRNRQVPIEKIAKLVELCQKGLIPLPRAMRLAVAGNDLKAIAQEQVDAVAAMQRVVAEFSRDIADVAKRSQEILNERLVELDARATLEKKALDDKRKNDEDASAAREAALDVKAAKLNKLEPRSQRRTIYQQIETVLAGKERPVTRKHVRWKFFWGFLPYRRTSYTDTFEARAGGWNDHFEVSQGTRGQRWDVHVLSLLVIGGLSFVWYKFFADVTHPPDSTAAIIFILIRQSLITGVLVTVFIMYYRFLTGWFDRMATEELRNRRLLLDVHRANWFAELAFQWQDEYGKAIPNAVIEKMTHRLFADPSEEAASDKLFNILKARYVRLKGSKDGLDVVVSKNKTNPADTVDGKSESQDKAE